MNLSDGAAREARLVEPAEDVLLRRAERALDARARQAELVRDLEAGVVRGETAVSNSVAASTYQQPQGQGAHSCYECLNRS